MAKKAPPPALAGPLDGFHEASREWFRSALGEPTRAQAMAWPHIAAGKTTLLLAPTGSGKTLAAFFSAIDRLATTPEPDPKKRLRVLYVSPLKALAVDVERNLRGPIAGVAHAATRLETKLRKLEVAVRTGDTPAPERAKMLRAPPDILITTPESLYLLLTSSQREMLMSVDTVIIDEIHQMAASKRGAHLFLSLERLEALRRGAGIEVPLQRVGLSATQRPLEEIARLLGGAEVKGKKVTPRHVEIVDASAKKTLSITVEVPPPLPPAELGPLDDPEEEDEQRSIWPQVHARIVERVRMARSTMIFVNSRRLAERLATALNETAGEEIALAHHGSVAKETRRATEERLKAGNLPAIVATSSLELGIDMGAVDQVIQVEAPPSIASGIQRIGRASHHVGGVPSGVLIPKHKHDLLACAAASTGIEDGDVEATYFARNPLDVLSQQIVAIAAIGLTASRRRPKTKSRKSAHGRFRTGAAKAVRSTPVFGGSGAKRAGVSGAEPLTLGEEAFKSEHQAEDHDDSAPITDVETLWDLVRQAAPFTELPRSSFDGILDMLAGRYPSDEFADLRPRITWDRTAGTISPRVGAQRLAILNGGTIPDRGLYGVFLKDDAATDGEVAKGSSKGKTSRRVGELDEEMVFELREGEVFLLGASSWRAEEITRDKVLVTPAAGIPGKMPFWHGDRAGRTVAFGTRIGKLTRLIAEKKTQEATVMLMKEHHLDGLAANDLVAYVGEEAKTAGTVPSDKMIVVERVPDELGDLRICILSPFGARVHAPWAMAALKRLKEERAGDIEAVWSDDGIVFRVPGGEEPPPTDLLFPSSEEVEDIVTRELAGSSLFAARFRESAARALLLPRQSIGKRTPLWAQRKRSADLLAVASQYPAFPIILETYREVLRDAFDLPGLVDLLRSIETRKIRVQTVDAPIPSPFAASLLFAFVGNFIYDEDAPAAERRAQALTIDHAQLRELLGEVELRKLLDADVVFEHERALQKLEWPLKHADGVHDLLLALGDVSEAELLQRGAQPAWLDELVKAKRIVRIRLASEARVIAVEDAARYRDALGVMLERGLPDVFLQPTNEPLLSLTARYARTHGPFVAATIARRWGIGESVVTTALEELVTRSKLAKGAFLPLPAGKRARVDAPPEYVDNEVLRALKQKTLARLRKAIEPVPAEAFARFLCEWQGVSGTTTRQRPEDALLKVVAQLEGTPIPMSVLESEVLPARVPGYRAHHLDHLLMTGVIVWAGVSPIGSNDGRIALYLGEREAMLAAPRLDEPPSSPIHQQLRELFQRRGAVFFQEVSRNIGGYHQDVLAALWDLVWAGEVSNDSLEPMRSMLRAGGRERLDRRSRQMPRRSGGPPGSEGRWSLRSARWPETPTATERAAAISRSLLERYGVVLREAAGAEGLPGGFGYVYDVYRAMEEQGRLRRGYFVAGRGATQFALPGAEERLRMPKKPDDEEQRPIILAATDPANPYGSLLPWPPSKGRNPMRAPGARVVILEGKLLAWLARGGKSMVTFFGDGVDGNLEMTPEQMQDARRLARALVAQNRTLMFETIDGEEAPNAPIAKVLAEHGFGRRQGSLVRIPPSDPSMGRRRLGAMPANASDVGNVGVSFDFGRRAAEPEDVELDESDLALASEEDVDDDTAFDTDFSASELEAEADA